MLNLTGYHVQTQLYASDRSRIYRAIRQADGCPVILKAVNQEPPAPERIARFQWEFDLTRSVAAETVVHAYAFERRGPTPVIVLEDVGATALSQLRRGHIFPVPEILAIAVRIAAALEAVHRAGIIHKDVNPSNLIYNPATGQLKLIDFGIAARLDVQIQHPGNPEVLEGTLAYISPEQTGRMNRVVDNRTDLYSFGVTLYELVAGQLPFENNGALKLVYDHLAAHPIPPCEINPDIPPILSAIVMKLLAKNADDRYQSAQGVRADLERCLAQLPTPDPLTALGSSDSVSPKATDSPPGRGKGWVADAGDGRWVRTHPQPLPGGEFTASPCKSPYLSAPGPSQEGTYFIPEFTLAQADVAERFRLPQKLYGREQELATLLAAFDRVSAAGQPEVLLVTGASGTGKSALVHELYTPLTRQRGLLLGGKFDQLQRNVPYYAIRQAFDEFVTLLLTEPEAALHHWRDRLLDAVGNIGQVVLDLAPRLEAIIGKQPPVAPVGPQETQNRFQLVVQNVLAAMAQPEHPVVLFLDDLQWADAASLNLLNIWLTDPQIHHLLLILAYRDNEVPPGHPLLALLADLQQAAIPVTTLPVTNLGHVHINTLLAETFACDPAQTRPLTELLAAHADGNALFIRQLLSAWHADHLIRFDPNGRRWQWDLEQIRSRAISADVIALMQQKLQRLPPDTQTLLGLAACIGNTFDLNGLSIIAERSLPDALVALHPAIQAQVILPRDAQYQYAAVEPERGQFRFLHDRVQQGAYDTIDAERKAAVHLNIGRLLLANTPEDQHEEHLFTIVNHLNAGRALLNDSEERIKLAELNLRAGLKAKASAAYQLTFQYVTIGIELLPETCWEQQYPLTFALYREQYECAYLTAHLEQVDQLFSLLLARANSMLDQAEIYNIGIVQLAAIYQHQKSLALGRIALHLFGVDLPQDNFEVTINNEFQAISCKIGNRTIVDLCNLPEMTDPEKSAIARILMNMFTPAFMSNPGLFGVIVVKTIKLVLQHGLTPDIPQAFAVYGGLVGMLTGDYQRAFEFGELAVLLSEHFAHPAQHCRTCHSVAMLTNPWHRSLRTSVAIARQGINYGLQCGETVYTEYCFSVEILMFLTGGFELFRIRQIFDEMYSFNQKFKHLRFVETLLPTWQFLLNLQGLTSSPFSFDDQLFQEAAFLEQYQYSPVACCQLYIYRLQSFYLYEQYADALRMAGEAEKLLASVAGIVVVTEYNFYASLTLCVLHPAATSEEQQTYRAQLQTNQTQMKVWAENCPENFRHKYLLVEAEIARIEGRFWDAVTGYRQGIAGAQQNGFLQNEAIGYELLAKFWLMQGDATVAQAYLRHARDAYSHWGATGKVTALEEKYPQFLHQPTPVASFEPFKPESPAPGTVLTAMKIHTETLGVKGAMLDAATLLRASEILAQEVHLDRLLRQIMELMLENAGAERGTLLLKEHDVWEIQAHGSPARGIQVLQRLPLEAVTNQPEWLLCRSVVDYVARSGESLVLDDAGQDRRFSRDAYIQQQQVKSLLCQPLFHQGQIAGLLYLENNLLTGAFTPERLEVLTVLCSRAAISLENARLYTALAEANRLLEERVQERTRALEESNSALLIAREAAETANRAKSAFLAHISHELRTPLNAILGYTQLMRRDQALTAKHLDAVATIHRSGEHLLLLINDLLDLARIEAQKTELHPTAFPFPLFLKNLLETARMRARQKDLTVTTEFAPDLPAHILADERRLRQILLNLLNNAIKFTDAGRITLRVRSHRFSDFSPLTPSDDGIRNAEAFTTGIHFEVEDTGIGVSPEHLPHIFESFYLVERHAAQEGSGLGLTISQQLVRLMGGELQVKSPSLLPDRYGFLHGKAVNSPPGRGGGWVAESGDVRSVKNPPLPLPGGESVAFGDARLSQPMPVSPLLPPANERQGGPGSTFWFDLSFPIVTADTSVKVIPERPLLGYVGERRKILIVDDNAENRAFLRDLLRPLGFEIQEADDGRDAVELAQNWQPHLILMDLLMAGMDGFDAVRGIRAEEQKAESRRQTAEGGRQETEEQKSRRVEESHQQSTINNQQSTIPTVIIAVSASVAESVRQESLAAGCDDFLPKPVGISALLDCLQRYLGLEWIYATPAAAEAPPEISMPLVLPPAEVLQHLIDLANSGYVNDLEDHLAELAQTDVRYLPFAAQMANFTGNLQLRELVAELEAYMQSQGNHAEERQTSVWQPGEAGS